MKHANTGRRPPPPILGVPSQEFLKFHAATKNTSGGMPRARGAMEKKEKKKKSHKSYSQEKSWKTGGSDFRAADKQQTYSMPGRLPNIATADAVRAEATAVRPSG